MCIATDKKPDAVRGLKENEPMKATDVPLGDGMADAARLSILTRREKIRQALEDAE